MGRPFTVPPLPRSWYIGHMVKSERQIRELVRLQELDLILEVRDARLPLTTRNPLFQKLAGQNSFLGEDSSLVKRAVAFLKKDLADERLETPILNAMRQLDPSTPYMFASTWRKKNVSNIVDLILAQSQQAIKTRGFAKVLIAGMPNVGKSSLINQLRALYAVDEDGSKASIRKVAATAPKAGHTRNLSGTIIINEDPKVYVYDSPGIMIPYLGSGEQGNERIMKLAAIRGVNEDLVPLDIVASYVLWRISKQIELGYLDTYEIYDALKLSPAISMDDPVEFFLALAMRLRSRDSHGEWDIERAQFYFMQLFWERRLGGITLDSLGRGDEVTSTSINGIPYSEDSVYESIKKELETPIGTSKSHVKAAIKEARLAQRADIYSGSVGISHGDTKISKKSRNLLKQMPKLNGNEAGSITTLPKVKEQKRKKSTSRKRKPISPRILRSVQHLNKNAPTKEKISASPSGRKRKLAAAKPNDRKNSKERRNKR